ncbi:hypothetical protein BC749_108165 [Flavobacterium araucananum]|uniref:Uncharacterized protein n=1 Tax=Flavobacterium araucananum TaxID=946678 RepID=A0A227NRV3_9FLAO|nr:hypothetical protein [Flavobacterium araucananum]OXG00003.1 hypothetical protein B0A64_20810 [Flavobacterium araucananum]PWJ97015.1 hypothetical protein BC749_108165 [Flavobacterium araucananum]
MKQLIKTFLLIPFFVLSCASAQYIKSYEPVNVFLETQKLNKNKNYILQSDKAANKQALKIFNSGEGLDHILDPKNHFDYTDGLFVEKHWKKMYEEYAQDTIKKYWKKEDFPEFDFLLEYKKGLLGSAFYDKYMNTGIEYVLIISEPMYYMDKKYIMFYFNKASFFGSNQPQVVIMKKEKEKWVVVRVIGDYAFY